MSEMQTSTEQGISGHAAARYWQATLARDARADGTFVLAVRSTHIYCRPSCPARRPLRRNVVFFHTREEAEKQGYRACLRCRPNEVSGAVVLVQRAVRHLAFFMEENVRLGVLVTSTTLSQGIWGVACRLLTGHTPGKLTEEL